jgi:type I restriction enzyme S subunit
MRSASSRFECGDVLYARLRPYLNKVWRADRDGLCSGEFIVLPGNSRIDAGFLRYRLNASDFVSFATRLNTGDRPRVDFDQIASFPIWLPESLCKQRRIVAEIDEQITRLDAGRASLERVRQNLKRYRASVLKSACEGRLVPTEAALARAEGRTFEPASELLARILAERRADWSGRGKYREPAPPDDSHLPRLPDGWTWGTIEQLSLVVQYGTSARATEDSVEVPVLRMGNIDEGRLVVDSLKYLPAKHDEFPDLLLRPGDLLFNRTNSAELVGKTAVYRGTPDPCSFASYLIRVRCCAGASPELIALFINSVFGRAWIKRVVNQQVGQANVNGSKLQALSVPLPPVAEQLRIVAEVESRLSVLDELGRVVAANLRRAARLRQSILQRALSGELV